MYKHYQIFIILLILARQFQLLLPVHMVSVCRVYVADFGASLHWDTSAVLQASIKKNNARERLKSNNEWSFVWKKKTPLRICDGKVKKIKARKVQNTILIKMETMTAWGRRGSWLFQSIVSAAPQFIYFIWYPPKYTFLLLVGSSSDLIKSWSSWVVIGRWHPADSWRPLPARELPLTCVSCNPFVNCQQYRKNNDDYVTQLKWILISKAWSGCLRLPRHDVLLGQFHLWY